jgi:hypothetical protein
MGRPRGHARPGASLHAGRGARPVSAPAGHSRAGRRLHQRARQFFAESRDALKRFAAYDLWLLQEIDDGTGKKKVPRRQIYEKRAQKNDAQAIAYLTGGPQCPPVFSWLWDRYVDLLAGIEIAGLGVPRLTWHNLDAWLRRRDLELSQYEIDVLFELFNVKAEGPDV